MEGLRLLPRRGSRTLIRRSTSALVLGLVASLSTVGCSRPSVGFEEPPNILLIVVDTLRADHLPFYGYGRDTAPHLTELMAHGGVTFENAYAPASWTSPSIAAILTGKDPSRLVHRGDLRAFGIPRDERTLAERLGDAGYDTAAFVGNTLIHRGHGFAQGFRKFWLIPGALDSVAEPADRVLEPALNWFRTRAALPTPFFVYAHFMDPHDPYTSPALVEGRSEFYPDYSGPIRGEDVHFLNEGSKRLSIDPGADVLHLRALYDSEIKYVDRAVGRLIEAAEASSRRRTLVAFVSDHGEELYDHGGWGHARTVYEETIRVPLLFRVDGLVRGGTRVSENVEILDLGRTILAAAGLPGDDLDGASLLPVILGDIEEPKRRSILVRHWQRGPVRAALVVDHRRTLLFNSRQSFDPDPGLERHLWIEDSERLHRFAIYDLSRDPHQQRPSPPSPDDLEAAYTYLDPTLDGVRVLLRGLGEGDSIAGSLRFASPPSGSMPLFLAEADEVSIDGTTVRFRLTGEPSPKGFLVLGETGTLEAVEVEPPASVTVQIGSRARSAAPIGAAELLRTSWPAWSGRAGLRIWSRESQAAAPERPLDAETRAKLRALGYL